MKTYPGNMLQIYRITHMVQLGCSPVNFLHVLLTIKTLERRAVFNFDFDVCL